MAWAWVNLLFHFIEILFFTARQQSIMEKEIKNRNIRQRHKGNLSLFQLGFFLPKLSFNTREDKFECDRNTSVEQKNKPTKRLKMNRVK